MEQWDEVYNLAKRICCKPGQQPGIGMALDSESLDGPDMRHFLRSTMESKVGGDLHWK